MNIAIIHTDFRIYWPARLQALHAFLRARGHQLSVVEIAGEGSPYAFSERAATGSLPWHVLFPHRKAESLAGGEIKPVLFRLLDELQPDVLVAGAIAFPSGALSVAWAVKNKRGMVCFDDAKIEAVGRGRLVTLVKQHIYAAVDAMLYPSADWAETGRFWHFRPEQLFYGVDVVDNAFWQDYHGEPSGLPVRDYLLAVGRQIPKKNFFHIVQSYARYRERYGPAARPLVLIGDGPEHARIRQFVDERGLSGSVLLLPFKAQAELRAVYHHAEALILSSSSETWGLVINEAMACGVPVLASDQCGATHTLVQQGKNGYAFSLDRTDDLFEKLCLFHDLLPQAKAQLGQNARATIAHWGLDRFCQGCANAVDYAARRPRQRLSLLTRFLIRHWKGRYRPV